MGEYKDENSNGEFQLVVGDSPPIQEGETTTGEQADVQVKLPEGTVEGGAEAHENINSAGDVTESSPRDQGENIHEKPSDGNITEEGAMKGSEEQHNISIAPATGPSAPVIGAVNDPPGNQPKEGVEVPLDKVHIPFRT